jgi:hypothetical protein
MTLLDMSAYASQKGQTMTEWQNVGVRDNLTGRDIPTKSELKRQIGQKAATVTFYSTDAFGANAEKLWFGDSLTIGVKYSVAGPNPYTSRKWFATVERSAKGTITVK